MILFIRQDDMDHIDVQVLSSHLRQRRDAVWRIAWTFALGPVLPEDSRLCTQQEVVC